MTEKEGYRLYLDFDGVLNNDPFLRFQRNMVPKREQKLFDPQNVAAVDVLCSRLPVVRITISSSWRQGRTVQQLQQLLRSEGMASSHLIDSVTPTHGNRVDEILAHAQASRTDRFLVLDDMNLLPLTAPQFFRTSTAVGLNAGLCREIVGILRYR
jgi:hypothetical protein